MAQRHQGGASSMEREEPAGPAEPVTETTPEEDGMKRGTGLSPRARNTVLRVSLPLAVLVVLLLAWQYVPQILHVQSFILPKFSSIAAEFARPSSLRIIASDTWTTTEEALIGFVIGAVIGVVLGLILGDSRLARIAMYPYIIALQSLPKVAIAPLFVIWFGFDMTPKVLIVVVLTFFPVVVNTMTGVQEVDRDQSDLFRALCASRLQTWRKLLLPASVPAIFGGLEVAAVLSLLGAIVGEFVSATKGMGVLIQQNQTNYDTASVFADLIVLSIVGVIFNRAIVLLRRLVLIHRPDSARGASVQ